MSHRTSAERQLFLACHDGTGRGERKARGGRIGNVLVPVCDRQVACKPRRQYVKRVRVVRVVMTMCERACIGPLPAKE